MTPDVVLAGEGENRFFRGTVDERVGRLERSNWVNFRESLHLLDIKVGDADPADFAFVLESHERRPAFLNVLLRFRPMDLIQIDYVNLQSQLASHSRRIESAFRLFWICRSGVQTCAHLVKT